MTRLSGMREEVAARGGGGGRGDASSVQSVDRALRILEHVADRGAAGIAEIAAELGVHRSTAFRLLATLEARRFVVRGADGAYRLGAGALRIAGAVTARVDFAREAQLVCDEVTAELGETSNVAILVDGDAVNIAQATGSGSVAVRDQFVGQRTPAHATSSGKVLLASEGPAALERVIAEGLRRYSESTIVEPERLSEELRLVRDRGWAAALAEWQEHAHAVAVPVRDSDGAVIAALSVTAPAFRMPESELPALAATLRAHADELSRRLGHRVPPARG